MVGEAASNLAVCCGSQSSLMGRTVVREACGLHSWAYLDRVDRCNGPRSAWTSYRNQPRRYSTVHPPWCLVAVARLPRQPITLTPPHARSQSPDPARLRSAPTQTASKDRWRKNPRPRNRPRLRTRQRAAAGAWASRPGAIRCSLAPAPGARPRACVRLRNEQGPGRRSCTLSACRTPGDPTRSDIR